MKLKKLRLAADLQQEDLEALSGVHQTTISAIERGLTRHPLHETLVSLADALTRAYKKKGKERLVTADELMPARLIPGGKRRAS